MLNYRKIEAWDLLIDEVVSYCENYGIDGIHLDNGQAWPQIMEPDLDELSRLDVDGQPAYSAEDLMNGEMVIRNENYGYWNSNNMETYPNPFFIKMCKKLWSRDPNFMIIGECWGGFMFEHRQIILARSGIIPRLYKLPIAISSLFERSFTETERLSPCRRITSLPSKSGTMRQEDSCPMEVSSCKVQRLTACLILHTFMERELGLLLTSFSLCQIFLSPITERSMEMCSKWDSYRLCSNTSRLKYKGVQIQRSSRDLTV